MTIVSIIAFVNILAGVWFILRGLYRVLFSEEKRGLGGKDILRGVVGIPLVMILWVFFAVWLGPDVSAGQVQSEAPSAQTRALIEARQAEIARQEEQRAERACLNDIHCWGERHFVAASVRCPDQIERLARYSMEWTDGILEPKFSHYRFSPLGDGIVVYIGDTARFQNGFGAWQNMVYECTYDPATEQVLDAMAQPGRL